MLLISAILSGIGLGSMYGLIALGYHVTYAVANTVNFAQGSALMLGAVLGYTFSITFGWPISTAIVAALAICGLFGLLVERALVRPFVARGSRAWLMATVAGGILLDNVVMFTYGRETPRIPSVLAVESVAGIGGGVYPLQRVIPLGSISVFLAR